MRSSSPWENAYAEPFIGRLGDELVKREVFMSIMEAKVLVGEYRKHHNERRPHSAPGYRMPREFVASCAAAGASTELTKELESATALSQ